jgi:hypothetical protein
MTTPLDEAVERVKDAFERTDEEGFSPEIEQVFVDYLPTILNALSPDEERVARAIWTAPLTGQPKGKSVRSWPPSNKDAMTETMRQARAAIQSIVGERP